MNDDDEYSPETLLVSKYSQVLYTALITVANMLNKFPENANLSQNYSICKDIYYDANDAWEDPTNILVDQKLIMRRLILVVTENIDQFFAKKNGTFKTLKDRNDYYKALIDEFDVIWVIRQERTNELVAFSGPIFDDITNKIIPILRNLVDVDAPNRNANGKPLDNREVAKLQVLNSKNTSANF